MPNGGSKLRRRTVFNRRRSANAEEVEASLLLFEELRQAVAAGDSQRAKSLVDSIHASNVLMLEGAAISARARAELFPQGQSQAYQARAHAATLEGAAVMLSRTMGRVSAAEAAAALKAQVSEARLEIRAGRAALEREVEASPDTDPALIARILPLQRKTFDELEIGVEILARAATSAADGRDLAPHVSEHNQSQQRLGAVSRQQSEALN